MRFCLILLSILNLFQSFGQTHYYQTWRSNEGVILQVRTETKNGWGEPKNLSETYESIETLHLACVPKQLKDVYLIFEDNGKQGIINSKGKVEIPAVYESISRVGPWHEFGGVSPFDTRYFILGKEGTYSILEAKNLKKFTKETFVKVEADIQNGDLVCYTENSVKYLDQTGEVLMPDIIFKEIKQVYGPNIYDDENYEPPHTILAREEGKPLQIYSTKFSFNNSIDADIIDFGIPPIYGQETLFVRATKNGKMGVLDGEGNEHIPFIYDDLQMISRFLQDSLILRIITVKDEKEGLIDFSGTEIYPTEFLKGAFTNHIHDARENLFIIYKDTITEQGLVDINGNVLIPIQEQWIRELHSNGRYEKRYFEVKRDDQPGIYTDLNKVGIYDDSGTEVIPCEFFMIHDENVYDSKATSPKFITFSSSQEWSEYFNNH